MQDEAYVSIILTKPSCGCAKWYYCRREAEVEILWLGVWTLQKLLERTSGLMVTDTEYMTLTGETTACIPFTTLHKDMLARGRSTTFVQDWNLLTDLMIIAQRCSTPAVPNNLAFWGKHLNNWCGFAAWNLEQIFMFPATISILINDWTEEGRQPMVQSHGLHVGFNTI